jgi:hypothetical protein
MKTTEKSMSRMSVATVATAVTCRDPSRRRSTGLNVGAVLAAAAGIVALAACGGGGDDATVTSAATASPTAHALRGGGGGTTQPVTPMLTLSTTAPAPGVLAYESFGYGGYGELALLLSRPTGGKGTARYAFGSPLNAFWVEYAGGKIVQWLGADGGVGIPSWDFYAVVGLLDGDSYSLLTPVDPDPVNSGLAGATWSPAMGNKIPTALMPFTPPATAYEVWIDGRPSLDPVDGYIAVGLTNSAVTANNFESVGQVWLSQRWLVAGRIGLTVCELRLNGRTGPLLATATLPVSSQFSQLLLRYDPVAKVLSASVNGTSLGEFPLALAPSRYAGIEGFGTVNNFMIRNAP